MANKEYFVLTGTLIIKYMYTQIASFHLLLDKWLLHCLEISHSQKKGILLNPSNPSVLCSTSSQAAERVYRFSSLSIIWNIVKYNIQTT